MPAVYSGKDLIQSTELLYLDIEKPLSLVNIFPPITSTYDPAYKLDLDKDNVQHYVIFLGQRSFHLKVMVQKMHTDTDTQLADCCTQPPKLSG